MPSFEVLYPLLLLLPLLLPLFVVRARKLGPGLPPGPWPLPIIGNLHMLGQRPHRALAKLAQKHGPIMSLRLGHVRTIVVSSAEAAEAFLKQHDAVFAGRPTLQMWDHMSYGGKDVAVAPYGDYWRRMRKLVVSHLLSPAKVAGFEGLRRAEVGAAVRRLREAAEAREVVDVGERVGDLTEEMVFKMMIGKGKEKEKCEKYDFRGALEGQWLWLEPLTWLIVFLGLLPLTYSPTDEASPSFGQDNVKALMFDMFVGSIETMVVVVTWTLSALLKHPRTMKLVQAEVDDVVGRDRMVEESHLSKLNYLDMVMKEAFRLYPPGPLFIPHESIEDTIVKGFMIPKKSRVIINMWAIGHDSNVWSENVEQFYPERFMNKDIDIRGQHFQLIPFGAGRRMCPGLQLALTTTKLVIAHLVHCFDWELPNGMRPEEIDMTENFGSTMPRADKLLATPYYRLQVTH